MSEQFMSEVADLLPKVRASKANVVDLHRVLSKYPEVSNQDRWPFVNARTVCWWVYGEKAESYSPLTYIHYIRCIPL